MKGLAQMHVLDLNKVKVYGMNGDEVAADKEPCMFRRIRKLLDNFPTFVNYPERAERYVDEIVLVGRV